MTIILSDYRPLSRKICIPPNILREITLHTDVSTLYRWTGKRFAAHETVTHSMEKWFCGIAVSTSIAVRPICTGIWRSLISAYNHRKITDKERTVKALEGIEGKRLRYRRPDKTTLN